MIKWGPGESARRRLLIVGEIAIHRDGVAFSLERTGDFVTVGRVAGADSVAAAEALRPDAILLDTSWPDALTTAGRLRGSGHPAPVIGFGIGCDEVAVRACAEAGLVGFVCRNATIEELSATVSYALLGEVRCSPRLAALLCDRAATLSRPAPPPVATPLSRREEQVAGLIAAGLSNKEIALALGIGPETVKNHVHNLLEKMQVARRGAVGARLLTADNIT